jgi:zinc protease
MMCYGAGSRCDPVSRSGLAHLCEHLAFYGPRCASGRTFPERIEIVGGAAQAITMTDRVHFSAVFPRRDLAAVLAVEAERMARPLEPQDAEALEIQRRVLIEELHQRSQSRLRAAAFEHIHRCLHPEGHPYRRPPAGELDGIRAVTADDLEAFVASYFSPRNAVLVLVGDLSIAKAVELVRRAFDALPAGAEHVPEAASAAQPPRDARPVRVPAAVSGTHAHVAWSVPGFGAEGWHVASLLMRGLTAGRSSPLARELVDRAGLAHEVRGSLVAMRDSSTLVFGATAARGVDSQRLEQGLLEASDRLLSCGLSAAGLARARKKALSDHYFAAESFERRADLCASLACYLDAPERLEQEPLRYLAPDQDVIAAFASALRQEPARAMLSLIPTTEAA